MLSTVTQTWPWDQFVLLLQFFPYPSTVCNGHQERIYMEKEDEIMPQKACQTSHCFSLLLPSAGRKKRKRKSSIALTNFALEPGGQND